MLGFCERQFNRINTDHSFGLVILCLTSMWESFSYYGMKALLVLYLTQSLSLSDHKAFVILGGYGAIVYITPMIGAVLSRYLLGCRVAVVIGCVLMTLGHLCLAWTGTAPVFYALATIALGAGFAKPNMVNLVGQLYSDHPQQKESGFTLYYVGSNVGAILAPLLCGYASIRYGFHCAFAIAGIGMLFGLLVFVAGRRFVIDAVSVRGRLESDGKQVMSLYAVLGCGIMIAVPLAAYLIQSHFYVVLLDLVSILFALYLTYLVVTRWADDGRQLLQFMLLLLFGTIFWGFDQQAASSITLFTDRFVDHALGSWIIPTATFQSINPAVILIFGPVLAGLWTVLSRRRNAMSFLVKFAVALALAAVSFFILEYAASLAMHGKMPSCLWVIAAYWVISIGELCCEPIGLAAANALSPIQFIGLMITAWYLYTGAYSNYIASLFASLSSVVHHHERLTMAIRASLYHHLFLEISLIAAASAMVLLLVSRCISWLPAVQQEEGSCADESR